MVPMTEFANHDHLTPLLIIGGPYEGNTARGQVGVMEPCEGGFRRTHWVLWLDEGQPFRSGLFIPREHVRETH